MDKSLLAGASLAVLITSGTLALAEMRDKEFVGKAIETNLAEIALGKLSLEKSKDSKVRSYGEKMIKEHGTANKEAAALAKKLKVTLPTKPSPKDEQTYEELAGLMGAEFDEKFAAVMVAGHEQAIAMFKDQAAGKDNTAKFAKKMLPHLEEHLKLAKSL